MLLVGLGIARFLKASGRSRTRQFGGQYQQFGPAGQNDMGYAGDMYGSEYGSGFDEDYEDASFGASSYGQPSYGRSGYGNQSSFRGSSSTPASQSETSYGGTTPRQQSSGESLSQGAACPTPTFPQQDEPAKGRGMNDPLSYH
jgi:hypothetical protein